MSSNVISIAASLTSPPPRRVAVELGLAQVREEVRDVWLTRWFRDTIPASPRSLLRSPGFTAVTLLSLVDQVILHAVPIHDPAGLVLVD